MKPDPLTSKAARDELLGKIDIIPSSLALAQAANESAWGQSRFAQEANNLFGIWTYDKDKGLVPRNREQGKKHLVRIFDDVGESVRYYMHTLNSHPAYAGLREIREDLRASGLAIDGHKLAVGLEKYTAKGQQYIDLIQGLIRQYGFKPIPAQNLLLGITQDLTSPAVDQSDVAIAIQTNDHSFGYLQITFCTCHFIS